MKKKERKKKIKTKKGFTLIELLATLIILVIIVYIAFIVIVQIMNRAKVKGFQVSLDNMENWIAEQYEMTIYTGNIMAAETSLAFSGICGSTGEKCFYSKNDDTKTGAYLNTMGIRGIDFGVAHRKNAKNFITTSGAKPGNYSEIFVAIDKESKHACVKAVMSTTGEFFYEGIIEDNLNYDQSSSCSMEVFEGLEQPTISDKYQNGFEYRGVAVDENGYIINSSYGLCLNEFEEPVKALTDELTGNILNERTCPNGFTVDSKGFCC